MNRMERTVISRSRYDAIVVGARCAGAATAMLLARQGLRVLAVDRGSYGADTLSTHALMRGGVVQLQRWGLLPAVLAAGTPPIRTVTFDYAGDEVVIPIATRDGVDALVAPRRTVLDRILVDAAAAAGTEVVHGLRATGLIHRDDGRVTGVVLAGDDGDVHRVFADVVVGADGLRSTVAKLAGARVYRHGRYATGVVYGYWHGLGVDGYRWYYRPGLSAGAIATNDGLTCLFASAPARDFPSVFAGNVESGYLHALEQVAPDLAARLGSARRVGRLSGFSGQTGFFRHCWGPGWVLVGDAGYFKDPLTAHGITDALRDAELSARAVLAGSDQALQDYQATRDELAGGLFDVTDAVASFEWDMRSVRDLHKSLAREMSRESETLAGWSSPEAVTAAKMGPFPAQARCPQPAPAPISPSSSSPTPTDGRVRSTNWSRSSMPSSGAWPAPSDAAEVKRTA
jgi:flavin-dependent dehydrogenase